MITSVKIENFKSIRHQEIALEPLTVFVGPNGSGKTSVLEAMLHAASAARPQKRAPTGPVKVFGYERHCDWLYTRGGTGDLAIACTTSGGTISVNATPPYGFPPQQTDLLGKGRWTFKVSSPDGTVLEDAWRPAQPMVSLHLDARKLAKASYSDRTQPRIEADGEGLASVLAYMALNDPDAFEKLLAHMRSLIPNLRLKRIRFRKVPIVRSESELLQAGTGSFERQSNRTYSGEALLFDFQNANNVAAHTVSEGTLILLGLLTALLGPTQPRLLLMDDIERGLHPLAQKALVGVLKQVMQTFPDLQIIATTHSPYLLDQLQPEQIRLMTLDDEGYSICGRLSNHPQFDRWKDEMAPGELWSLFGEKWLAEGGAAK